MFPVPGLAQVDGVLLRIIAVLAPVSAAQYAWIVIQRVSAPPQPEQA